jgi:hypothetical protein
MKSEINPERKECSLTETPVRMLRSSSRGDLLFLEPPQGETEQDTCTSESDGTPIRREKYLSNAVKVVGILMC